LFEIGLTYKLTPSVIKQGMSTDSQFKWADILITPLNRKSDNTVTCSMSGKNFVSYIQDLVWVDGCFMPAKQRVLKKKLCILK
jgi:hypothetical protein